MVRCLIMLVLCVLLALSQNVSANLFGRKSTDLNGNSPIALWMQQSGVAVRICQREDTVESYNNGLSPLTAQITIGRCQDQLVKPSANVTATKQVCPGFRACSPTISEIIPLRTNNGIKEITNEMGCKCLPLPSGCKRLSSLRSFYRGTKYERVIDVGKCTGNCGNKSCQPLSIKTVAIKTPNGRKEVKVIEKCGCESSCYRMSYKKAYSIASSSNNASNVSNTYTKVIDVGICSGKSSCAGTVQGTCLYWVTSKQKRVCVIRTDNRPVGCYADKTRTLVLNTVPNKEVHIIDSCACS